MAWELPLGFQCASVHSGLKSNAALPDLALVVSERPAAAAGVFTTNRVCAAPVQLSRQRVPSDHIRGIVINSGNANACTGDQGRRDAEAMTARLAERLGALPEQILVCSTGVIGRPLPLDRVLAGIDAAHAALGSDAKAFEAAAKGILTTDTRTKTATRTLKLPGGNVQLAGFAKGAAMIGPNMATMLGFILTDAKVASAQLATLLRRAVDISFHCISVEGHTSTNDTVLLLANGASGVAIASAELEAFRHAVSEVCCALAQAIIDDAEGASHTVTIDVTGTRTDAEARQIAKTVADSALVKTALFGNDPNWGRICSAAGYAGVAFDEKDLSLTVNGTRLYDKGQPTRFDPAAESERMKSQREVKLHFEFTLGSGRARFWTCDLTYEYVRLNAEYTT